jgi:hypothetical protein
VGWVAAHERPAEYTGAGNTGSGAPGTVQNPLDQGARIREAEHRAVLIHSAGTDGIPPSPRGDPVCGLMRPRLPEDP